MSELRLITDPDPQCQRCGARNVVPLKRSLSKKRKALVQAYLCKACGSSYTAGTWKGLSATKATIEYAIALKCKGYTLDEIAKVCGRREGTTYSYHTVLHWIRRLAPDIVLRRGSGRGIGALAGAIRKHVTVEQLAADIHVSPTRVEEMLANLETYSSAAPKVTYKGELRALRGVAKTARGLERSARLLVASLEKKRDIREKARSGRK